MDWTDLTLILLGLCALLHSVGGEVYLIRPLFKRGGNKVLESWLARRVLRFAWHCTAVTWVLLAAVLAVVTHDRAPHADLAFLIVGAGFLFMGLFDLIVSRGRHIGWPVLTLIGVSAIAAAYSF